MYLGYPSPKAIVESLLTGNITVKLTVFTSFLATLTAFIQAHIWQTPQGFYFWIMLLCFDFLTGIAVAIKNKVFGSRKLPRIAVQMVGGILLLWASNGVAVNISLAFFLPNIVYAVLVSQLFISLVENLSNLGVGIPKELKEFISEKFSLKNLLKK